MCLVHRAVGFSDSCVVMSGTNAFGRNTPDEKPNPFKAEKQHFTVTDPELFYQRLLDPIPFQKAALEYEIAEPINVVGGHEGHFPF